MCAAISHVTAITEPAKWHEEIVVRVESSVEIEVCRHNADHGPGFGVDRYRAAEHRGVASVAALPQPVAEHDYTFRRRSVFKFGERASELRLNAEGFKEAGGDPTPDDSFRFAVTGKHKSCRHSRGGAIESCVLCFPIEIVGI